MYLALKPSSLSIHEGSTDYIKVYKSYEIHKIKSKVTKVVINPKVSSRK
jgi:hypothetical protein